MNAGGRSAEPGYLALHEKGILAKRVAQLEKSLRSCVLCPRRCRVNRLAGELGACGVGAQPKVAAMSIHPWEEPPISGSRGSGTVFFSGCTLECLFCQNYPISQMGAGRILSLEELAAGLLDLQKKGAHNINVVTPTHQVPALLGALLLAADRGLTLPLVYNTSGYERVRTLRFLEGIVDIYLPDIKYADPEAARSCSGRADYVAYNRAALLEMWRQVGPIQTDENGIAVRGMLVRHMVLPENLSGTEDSLEFLAKSLGPRIWVSLMSQYFPAHRAHRVPPLHRKITPQEYERAFRALTARGLENGFVQEPSSAEGEALSCGELS